MLINGDLLPFLLEQVHRLRRTIDGKIPHPLIHSDQVGLSATHSYGESHGNF